MPDPKTSTREADRGHTEQLRLHTVRSFNELPTWSDREHLAVFLNESMKPYEDRVSDIQHALRHALDGEGPPGGFVLLGEIGEELVGALVMLKTGFRGYVPENILLFVGVQPKLRGRGIGRQIVQRALETAEGSVKLHVEHDNPARRLYERLGFTSAYAEMRYHHDPSDH